MTHEKIVKIIRGWFLGQTIYTVLLFLYIFIMGQTTGEIYLVDVLFYLSFLILVLSVVVGIYTIIYSIHKKEYGNIWFGVGEFLLAFILFMLIIVLSLSQIF